MKEPPWLPNISKTTMIHRLRVTILFAFLLLTGDRSMVVAQGLLTPPGAPAPTMKTLDQIEPRIPISSVPFSITQSGSYYLTRNHTVTTGTAITIDADGVALDLHGFTLASTANPASGSGIGISSGRSGIVVRNGNILGTTTVSGSVFSGGGFQQGIAAQGTCRAMRISEIQVRAVGLRGIDLGPVGGDEGQLVERCQVAVCGDDGIRAEVVRDCVVSSAGGTGIEAAVVQTCVAIIVSDSDLVAAISSPASVQNSRGVTNAGTGINAETVANSTGVGVDNTGISARTIANSTGTSTEARGISGSLATNCQGTSSSREGIAVANAMNCVGESTTGSFGLLALGTASYCRGKRDGGTALRAEIAVGCTVSGTGSISAGSKHLGTP